MWTCFHVCARRVQTKYLHPDLTCCQVSYDILASGPLLRILFLLCGQTLGIWLGILCAPCSEGICNLLEGQRLAKGTSTNIESKEAFQGDGKHFACVTSQQPIGDLFLQNLPLKIPVRDRAPPRDSCTWRPSEEEIERLRFWTRSFIRVLVFNYKFTFFNRHRAIHMIYFFSTKLWQ